jgi:hypothetical protein
MRAMVEDLGTVSLSSSRRLPLSSGARMLWPVMFPPECDKLATKPVPTGSPTYANTMGMLPVTAFTAAVAGVVWQSKPTRPEVLSIEKPLNYLSRA